MTATTAIVLPWQPRSAGERACATSAPAPADAMPAAARWASVSSRARSPKSSAWLLASVTQLTPNQDSVSAADGGARKKNGLPGAGHGSPRSETQHSRFSTHRSASATTSRSPGENTECDPSASRRAATARPSIVSPASATVTGSRSAPGTAGMSDLSLGPSVARAGPWSAGRAPRLRPMLLEPRSAGPDLADARAPPGGGRVAGTPTVGRSSVHEARVP